MQGIYGTFHIIPENKVAPFVALDDPYPPLNAGNPDFHRLLRNAEIFFLSIMVFLKWSLASKIP